MNTVNQPTGLATHTCAPPSPPPPPLKLLIVAKARMKYGLCYMGYDLDTKRLIRPLYSAEEDKQCWSRSDPPNSDFEFIVGEIVTFPVIRAHPPQSSLPHWNEDVLVSSIVARFYRPFVWSHAVMFDTLFHLSSSTVEAIFGISNIVRDRLSGFVWEGTRACPSVGIYSCTGADIELYDNSYGKPRFRIQEPSNVYEFSGTAEDSYPQPLPNDSVLLLLGLARPWVKPDIHTGQPVDPPGFRRCYILVIGMIIKRFPPPDAPPSPPPPLKLLIVAKAKMNYGLCYMGYDLITKKLNRPLYNAEEGKQCWPRSADPPNSDFEFIVGEIVTFPVIRAHPPQSSLPHWNEDVLVSSIVARFYRPFVWSHAVMFDTLFHLSSSTVEAIFGISNIVRDGLRGFVWEGTRACPSIGIYSCTGADIKLYDNFYGKPTFRIQEPSKVYDFSGTAEEGYTQPLPNDSVLLLLGLARPWEKRDKLTGQPVDPPGFRRCYILVIGMIIKLGPPTHATS